MGNRILDPFNPNGHLKPVFGSPAAKWVSVFYELVHKEKKEKVSHNKEAPGTRDGLPNPRHRFGDITFKDVKLWISAQGNILNDEKNMKEN